MKGIIIKNLKVPEKYQKAVFAFSFISQENIVGIDIPKSIYRPFFFSASMSRIISSSRDLP